MKKGTASYTAEAVAAYRAAESAQPAGRRVCYDPFAEHFLRFSYRAIGKSRFLTRIVLWLRVERPFPGGVGEVIARTRHIDDYLQECIGKGIKQLVILGAGYDSRAYRIEALKGRIKVFEVDHPDTQKAKMAKIKKLLGSLPDGVVYVPVDFNQDRLDERLFASGYDRNLKTLFIWEGVTMYITADAVDETLAFVADNSGEGSFIIFNYVYRSVVDGTSGSAMATRWAKTLRRLGEPVTFGIEEGGVERFLHARGFTGVRNATSDFFEKAYFRPLNKTTKAFRFLATASATVETRIPLEWVMRNMEPVEEALAAV